jgi:hypothetical protein
MVWSRITLPGFLLTIDASSYKNFLTDFSNGKYVKFSDGATIWIWDSNLSHSFHLMSPHTVPVNANQLNKPAWCFYFCWSNDCRVVFLVVSVNATGNTLLRPSLNKLHLNSIMCLNRLNCIFPRQTMSKGPNVTSIKVSLLDTSHH